MKNGELGRQGGKPDRAGHVSLRFDYSIHTVSKIAAAFA
jgi:hypothetical protein